MKYEITYTKVSEHTINVEAPSIGAAVDVFDKTLPIDTLEKNEDATGSVRKVVKCEEDPYTDYN